MPDVAGTPDVAVREGASAVRTITPVETTEGRRHPGPEDVDVVGTGVIVNVKVVVVRNPVVVVTGSVVVVAGSVVVLTGSVMVTVAGSVVVVAAGSVTVVVNGSVVVVTGSVVVVVTGSVVVVVTGSVVVVVVTGSVTVTVNAPVVVVVDPASAMGDVVLVDVGGTRVPEVCVPDRPDASFPSPSPLPSSECRSACTAWKPEGVADVRECGTGRAERVGDAGSAITRSGRRTPASDGPVPVGENPPNAMAPATARVNTPPPHRTAETATGHTRASPHR